MSITPPVAPAKKTSINLFTGSLIVAAALAVIKLTGLGTYDWFWVFFPVIVSVGLIVLFIVLVILILLLALIFGTRNK